MSDTLLQRPLAQADVACPIDTVLARASVRPLIEDRSGHGRIRRVLSMTAIAVLAVLTIHVAMADPLARVFRDIERAEIDYCGKC